MKKKLIMIILAVTVSIAAAGCKKEEAKQTEAPKQTTAETQTPTEKQPEITETTQAETKPETAATLYIGYGDSFQEYPFETSETITPDVLVQAIADLTGWDLTLADTIASGKGGMTVCFSSQSALFTGPPMQQKEEFHMFDTYQLVQTILGSIQRTLQYYYVNPELGDPSNLDIYYCMEGYQPLTIPNIDVTIPMEQPYSGSIE